MPDRPVRYGRQRHARRVVSRPSATQRGYGSAWQRASRAYLAAHPLCVACLAAGRTRAADCVDHIRPHRGDRVAFWDAGNWQSLCNVCHGHKSVQERGAAGDGYRVRRVDPGGQQATRTP